MRTDKCCVPLCEKPPIKQDKITYRTIHNTVVTAEVFFCCDCKVEDLFKEITSEDKLRLGGF
jgi:hypothetical protein